MTFLILLGTLTSVANVSGKIGSNGKIEDIDKAMLSDSVSTVAGAVMGTSTVTTYVLNLQLVLKLVEEQE